MFIIEKNKKTIFPKFLEYGIYGFLALFPFFIFNSFLYQGSSSRFLILVLFTIIGAIGLSFYFFNRQNTISIVRSPILVMFGVYLAYIFISGLLGADFSTSLWSKVERASGLFYLTQLAIFVFFLVMAFSFDAIRKASIKIIVVTSALYSLALLLGPQGFNILFTSNPYDGFLFGNSSFAAMYLLGAFLLSLYSFQTKEKFQRLWYDYLIPFVIVCNPLFINLQGSYEGISSIFGIAQASSIALFASLGIVGVIYLGSRIKDVKKRNCVGVILFVCALLTLALATRSLLVSGGLVRTWYEQQSTLARLLVWDISKNAITEKPLTGWGNDNFILAYQEHFDVRLLTQEYGNEAWFDRAHNIVLDQTLDHGYIGVVLYFVLYLLITSCLLFVILKTKKRDYVILASVLLAYFLAHLLELQTAFDTTISAVMFAVMLALSIHIFNETQKESGASLRLYVRPGTQIVIGSIFFVYAVWSFFSGVIPFLSLQVTNIQVRNVGSAEKRIPLYSQLFDTKLDKFGVIWMTSTDFQKAISHKPEILSNPEKVKFLIEELGIITKAYEDYVKEHPYHLRAKFNLADVYIYHMLFGIDRLEEAHGILDEAIRMSDTHPQPYWMKAVVYLYQGNFTQARAYVLKAKMMNSEVLETKRLEEYIENSIRTFPEIDLYFFYQI